ncbi:conserved hypothetical protein [Vibrio crassostreae]|nr:conserved hypothetical protein [Vibrio crassostreae]CAK2951399.1 conserved hypothetical protein [Vibrio crassostreae]CAK2952397.1 conserved hypothetical protein [Vibrio crassostreae]CAK2952885.1 conserved hypothetical protein [Vibrio crassostreae]CAK2955003.1 conserved hypothetical protein [Vibrio crassostreae]
MKKKILLIMPKFHGYETTIVNYLSRNYHLTSFVYDSNQELYKGTPFIGRILRKINSKFIPKSKQYFMERFYYSVFNRRIINMVNEQSFDYLLVIKGFGVTKETIKKIRARKKKLYQWDSISRFPTVVDSYSAFDDVFTFDRKDSNRGYGKYLPNFIDVNPEKKEKINNKKVIFFVGEYTKSRLNLLLKVKHKALDIGLEVDFALVDLNSKYEGSATMVQSSTVESEDYIARFVNADIILELPRDKQEGFTQRYYEALYYNKIVIGEHHGMYLISDFMEFTRSNIESIKPIISKYDEELLKVLPVNCWVEYILNQ